jgi:hypothetical protein
MAASEAVISKSVCDLKQYCDPQDGSPIIWYCATCTAHFCNPCWDQFLAHRSKSNRERPRAHEKTNEMIVKRMDEILDPPSDEEKLSQLHNDDQESIWFGV